MTTLSIEGHKVKVDDAFLSMPLAEQNAAVEEIAQQLNLRGDPQIMPHLNQGIAESAGGIIDFLNPFDKPHALNPFPEGTGSAVEAIEGGMDAIGVNRATDKPQGFIENFARGAGEASSAAVPAGLTASALRAAPGFVGQFAGEASKGLNTIGGAAAEAIAGGSARAAQSSAEAAGAPEWAQTLAAMGGGLAPAAIPSLARNTPIARGVKATRSAVKTAMMPYTETGSQEVARQRLQDLAGGPERAKELASRISNQTEIGLTPAQQTQDPNMLAVEQTAARQNPALRSRLDQNRDIASANAERAIRGPNPGQPEDAQAFFSQRMSDARQRIRGHIQRANERATMQPPQRTPTENSRIVSQQIENARKLAEAEEKHLWNAVPKGAQVTTANARRVAEDIIQTTPRAQSADIPPVVAQLLGRDASQPFGQYETVSEMHGLYSELRRIARAAVAGSDQNRNRARISNMIADAILEDLGAFNGDGQIGQTINAARAYSAAKAEIFDQGTLGRVSRTNLNGDDQTPAELLLDRSIGRGGSSGMVAYDDVTRVSDTSQTQAAISDYVQSRYQRSATGPDGAFNPRGAGNFVRDNSELLGRIPAMQQMFENNISAQTRAAATSKRGTGILDALASPSQSNLTAFTQAPTESAVDALFKAQRPSVAANALATTARKDPTGQATRGLKSAFSDYLIRRVGGPDISGEKMKDFLQSPERRSTLGRVFTPQELRRLDIIATELTKLERSKRSAPDIGALSNRSPNRVIEIVARVIAARQGAQAGGGGGASIQTANMASTRVKALLGNLQNDKAEQLLIDAVEDPELFRALLTDPGSAKIKPDTINRLIPYFTGAVAGMEQ